MDRTQGREGAAREEWVLGALFWGGETVISRPLTELCLGVAFGTGIRADNFGSACVLQKTRSSYPWSTWVTLLSEMS